MEATLIYPHQLFENHPAIAAGRTVWLIEESLFFGNDPHWPTSMHKQKLVLHRASMKAYASELSEVHYIEAICKNRFLEKCIPKNISQIHLCDPADSILMKRIRRFVEKRGIELVVHPSPNFLSSPKFLEAHIGGRKKPFMAKFYEAQRKCMGVLVEDDDSPVGGKWSFDAENRQKLPKNHRCPPEPISASNAYVAEAIRYVSKHFPDNPGSLDSFRWPVTRNDALIWLDRFFEERFVDFGIYEDAISTANAFINHAAITPMFNIGLLDPNDVVKRALAKGNMVPMNSLEGFIRQVIGWREFMHGLYRHRGTEIRNRNFWNFQSSLPRSFYDGTTGIPPVDRVIRQLLKDGYCHHIERLMVLGNFMLLCRIHPDEVYRWFMEMFIDSYDWVMVPNVYGMSLFADGGTFTTKPYLSGSNYIRKMSDEPSGDWCAIWDGLFWSFIDDHQAFFLKNPRLSMMVRTWQKMSPDKQETHRKEAADFLRNIH